MISPAVRPMDTGTDARRVLLVSSSGGHLAQLMTLRPWWASLSRMWVTFDTPDALSLLGNETTKWAYRPTTRNIHNLVRNLALAIRILRRWKPELVVSTGAGVAVPFFLVARLKRIPTIYIEPFERLDFRSLTGRICYPFASLFLVQSEEQLKLYPKGVVVGPLV